MHPYRRPKVVITRRQIVHRLKLLHRRTNAQSPRHPRLGHRGADLGQLGHQLREDEVAMGVGEHWESGVIGIMSYLGVKLASSRRIYYPRCYFIYSNLFQLLKIFCR